MKNQKEVRASKKSKWIKVAISFLCVATIVAIAIPRQSTASASGSYANPSTITLQKTDLTKTLSASGVVKSTNSQNIYSTMTNPVQQIFVDVGDRVKAGDILAQLDMSKLENDIAQAEINLTNAQTSAKEEVRTNTNNVINAQTSLDSSRISLERQQLSLASAEKDLLEAQSDMEKPFDSYTHDKSIEDAKINLERKMDDVKKAEEDLETALNDFDDYVYLNAINEAKITLNRRLTDLTEAEDELEKEQKNRTEAFDDYTYKNAINDAEKNLQRKKDDETTAIQNYNDALNRYYFAPLETQEAAWNSVQSAEGAIATAERAVEDAETALNKARTDLTRARNDYNDKASDNKENIITAAENAVTNAQKAVDDAGRAYHKAQSDLERAKSDAIINAGDALTRAQDNLVDAQRTYERALSDKERAIEDYIDNNAKKLENVEKALADSQTQIKSAQNSVQSAQNALNQAIGKSATSGTNVEIQILNIEKLESQLAEGLIIATTDGVVTEVNATVGAVPNGVLFVIEDIDNLYVSANVKEYSLSEINLGQQGFITTDATANRVYDAEVTFISPKAVSQAGSTSVEFELRVAMKDSDTDVKIGMNAFLNIITDTKTDIYVVPISAIETNVQGNFIHTLTGDEQTMIPVSIGLQTSTQAEIYGDGLYDGLQILSKPGVERESAPQTGGRFGGQ